MNKLDILPDGIKKVCDIICGCSDTAKIWVWIGKYLSLCAEENSYLSDETMDGSEILAINLMDYFGFIEHGFSIRGSWITARGREVIEFLRKYGVAWMDNYELEQGVGGEYVYMKPSGDAEVEVLDE